MSSKRKNNLFSSVAFRLVLWFTALFAILSAVSFTLVYYVLTSSLISRADEDLMEDIGEYEELYAEEGIKALEDEFEAEVESEGADRVFFVFLSPDMEVLVSSDLEDWEGIDFTPPELRELKTGETLRRTLAADELEHTARAVCARFADGTVIEIAESLEDDEELIATYRMVFLTAGACMVVIGALLGWWMARKAMSGVQRVTETALKIGKGNLAERVPVGREGREIRGLALAFNGMLERIEGLVREIKEVTDNVAHDLRSPITRIRGVAEASLTGSQDVPGYQRMAGAVVEESDRLVEMISTMLEIAEANSGIAQFARDAVSPAEIVENARDLFGPVADDKDITIEYAPPAEDLLIRGDNRRLQRVVANLLDNAIKYTPSGGSVLLSVKGGPDYVTVSITDSGSGMERGDLPHIFERFYRGERSRSTPGNGLGLSLAQAIVKAHGGRIDVESNPEKGSTFLIVLPRARADN
jgi:heavy metal sensor kinase